MTKNPSSQSEPPKIADWQKLAESEAKSLSAKNYPRA